MCEKAKFWVRLGFQLGHPTKGHESFSDLGQILIIESQLYSGHTGYKLNTDYKASGHIADTL